MSYRDLKSYEQATIVYDFTVEFCKRYVSVDTNDKSNRTYKSYRSYRSYRTADQMVQAARSGKQNIVEGSSERSQMSELKLIAIARASFEELLQDYEDFLRQHGMKKWNKDDASAQEIRRLAYRTNKSYKTYRSYLNDPETAANAAICLIHQVNFLLDRQISALEAKFIKEGGYTESLRTQRQEEKKKAIVNRFWRSRE